MLRQTRGLTAEQVAARKQRLHREARAAEREALEDPAVSSELLRVLLANTDGLLCVAVGGEIIYSRPGALRPAKP